MSSYKEISKLLLKQRVLLKASREGYDVISKELVSRSSLWRCDLERSSFRADNNGIRICIKIRSFEFLYDGWEEAVVVVNRGMAYRIATSVLVIATVGNRR